MEFFEIAGEMRWGCEKVLTERFPVRLFSRSLVPTFFLFFHDSLNKFLILILIAIVIAMLLAYVSRGLGRRGGAVNGTWLETHASVTLS